MASSRFLKLAQLKQSVRLCPRRFRHGLNAMYVESLKNLPETKMTELPNGLRVATEFTDSPTASVGLWIEAGSRNEAKSVNGVGNFFEHLAFKGTKSRALQDLEREVMTIGAELHACTGREQTMFYGRCLSGDVPKVVDILSDVVQNPKLDENEVEQQRKVILSELESIETDLKQVTFDHLHLTAYQGTPLESSVYGPSENIKKLTKDDIASYLQHNFTAPRMVLVGKGNVNHDEVVKLAEKHLGGIQSGGGDAVKPCRFTGSEIQDRDDWQPFAHVAVAVDTCGYTDPDIYPLMLAKAYVGSWDKTSASSAYTANTLVEHIYKAQGCHSYDAFHLLYKDTGLWGCYFVMDRMLLDDFVYNMQDEWMKLCVSVTEADLARIKAQLRNRLSCYVEDGWHSLSATARDVRCYNRGVPLSEVVDKIDAVTLNQLRDTCYKYIYDRCPAVAAVGPVEGMTDYNRLRAGMYWLRY